MSDTEPEAATRPDDGDGTDDGATLGPFGRLAALVPDIPSLLDLSRVPDTVRDLIPDGLAELVGGVRQQVDALRVLLDTGILKVERVPTLVEAARRFGTTTAATVTVMARHAPEDVGLIDDDGPVTWRQLHEQSNALAHHLRQQGFTNRDGLGVLCRNSRWFVLADLAGGKLGARTLYLNTGFGADQLREVLEREGARAVVFDDEYSDIVQVADEGHDRTLLVGHVDADDPTVNPGRSLASIIDDGPTTEPPPPALHAVPVVLTSGTTGTPKGARRDDPPRDLVTAASLFSGIPYRAGSTIYIAAPMFHAWGLANLVIAGVTGSTAVVRRRFDARAALASIHEHRCDEMALVPIMMRRMLDVPTEMRDSLDCSSLRVVATSGSALPKGLAVEWMDAFGDNLYNLYGSTEVSMATVAGPADLRAAEGTAGRPLLGVRVHLYGPPPERRPVLGPMEDGEIFVNNRMTFEGYTGGGSKEVIDGFMSVGDVGYFDSDGRLFVSGRADDMIISGGENLFPGEVEDFLVSLPSVAEACVVGVDDPEFGQRLRAVIVPTDPADPPDPSDLHDAVKASLANYKVPRDWVFVDELPRNDSGKVLRRALVD